MIIRIDEHIYDTSAGETPKLGGTVLYFTRGTINLTYPLVPSKKRRSELLSTIHNSDYIEGKFGHARKLKEAELARDRFVYILDAICHKLENNKSNFIDISNFFRKWDNTLDIEV